MRENTIRWLLGGTLATLLLVAPFVYYRWGYSHAKRLRVVTPGQVYRSGQLTAAGLEEALRRYHIRTVINLRDESPDPHLAPGVPESEVCRRVNARYVFIAPDLIEREELAESRPKAIAEYLAILDDPANYPVLLHCRAGLHRTGVLTALYRMEYQGWSVEEAVHELRRNGFGYTCHAENDYVLQYVLLYQPRAAARESVSAEPDAPARTRAALAGTSGLPHTPTLPRLR
jgi:protein tyrosine phosphatase (PTP) superfamily phosphohydrolase (DUF442 family)